jgi:phosphoglycolate/pyridoxal phosphate phosphatase family enzyme
MDGVLWLGAEKITKSIDALNLLRSSGRQIVFVTNSSGKLRSEYAKKLRSLGYPASTSSVITASSVAAEHLKYTFIGDDEHDPLLSTHKVFMIGNDALQKELENVGFEVLSVSESASPVLEEHEFTSAARNLDPDVKAVVVGMDTSFSYRKMAIASLYLQNGRKFIATNPDSADRVPGGFYPEVGSLVAAIEMASGVKPTVCGKPSDIMVKHVLGQLGCDQHKILMVGDRLDTDIQFANSAGFSSCLVLSGCTSVDQAVSQFKSGKAARMPTYVAANLWEIAYHLTSNTLNNADSVSEAALL